MLSRCAGLSAIAGLSCYDVQYNCDRRLLQKKTINSTKHYDKQYQNTQFSIKLVSQSSILCCTCCAVVVKIYATLLVTQQLKSVTVNQSTELCGQWLAVGGATCGIAEADIPGCATPDIAAFGPSRSCTSTNIYETNKISAAT